MRSLDDLRRQEEGFVAEPVHGERLPIELAPAYDCGRQGGKAKKMVPSYLRPFSPSYLRPFSRSRSPFTI